MLNICMQSKDMVKLYADVLGEEFAVEPFSAANDAPLAKGYAPVEKSEITNTAIIAETVTADCAVDKTVDAKVIYNGNEPLTAVRLTVACDVPIKSVKAADGNSLEFNTANGKTVVYAADGGTISGELFTITFDTGNWIHDGTYPIDLTLIEATDADAELISVLVADGAVIIDNTLQKGDVNGDGEVTNADLILIARYLVDLVTFNEKQKEAADFDSDGAISNKDLVLIARAIVAA
jgi:hypothetical protein